MPRISKLQPGTRFRLAEMPAITGTLVTASEARAVVRLDRPTRDVEFVDQNGEPRQFRCRGSQVTSWAPTTVVEPIGFETLNDEENHMSKAKAKKAPKSTKAGRDSAAAALAATINAPLAKAANAQKPPKQKPAKADGKLSCIDAAAKVLSDAKEPLTTKELIEQMAAKGLWKSANGQTPAATLYSAILREIQKKGAESRFAKADRGKFALADV